MDPLECDQDGLTVGSLFAGIGGFDLGLERAGMRSVWQCEINPYCLRVLEKHWPDVLRVPDIRDVRADTVPWVDVLCGGFPCQDLSVAGKQGGINGERSGLWVEYARVIDVLRPRYVIVENVRNLLAGDRGRWFGTVLGDLATCGYDAEWDCIPASAVGAPHRRDRVWLVAYSNGGGLQERGKRDGDQAQSRLAPPFGHDPDRLRPTVADEGPQGHGGSLRSTRELPPTASRATSGAGGAGVVADADQERRRGRTGEQWPTGWRQPQDGGWWESEPDVGRVAHGVPSRVDRLRALGNALVPQIAEWIGRRIVAYERQLTADPAGTTER